MQTPILDVVNMIGAICEKHRKAAYEEIVKQMDAQFPDIKIEPSDKPVQIPFTGPKPLGGGRYSASEHIYTLSLPIASLSIPTNPENPHERT